MLPEQWSISRRRATYAMHLTVCQLDILKELINIGVGKAAGLINQMIKSHVRLELPEILVLSRDELAEYIRGRGPEVLSTVRLGFRGSFSGWSGLIFPRESASWLVSQLLGDEGETTDMDLDSLRIGTIQEVGNIVLNGVMGSIVNVLKVDIDYFPPDYFETDLNGLLGAEDTQNSMVLMIQTQFLMEKGVAEGEVIILFHIDTFENMLKALDDLSQGITRQ